MLILKFITTFVMCGVGVGDMRHENGSHCCFFPCLSPGTYQTLITRIQHPKRHRGRKCLSVSVCGADGSWMDGRRVNKAGRRESTTGFQ